MSFSSNFLWGAATASYQIEGAAFLDGKGLSIWDVYSHTPGKVFDNHTGDIACDHYHKLLSDLDLLQKIGIKSYRFSVNWARILPDGIGQVNEAGIQFYNQLIDGLLERGITPCMTLYHWELPYALHLQGGWLNDASSDWFLYYATIIKDYFSDRVKYFITFNEPDTFVEHGYCSGIKAPGYKLSMPELIHISYNVLKAHGKVVKLLRDVPSSKIGISCSGCPCIPVNTSPETIQAAKRSTYYNGPDHYLWSTTFWLDPVVKGDFSSWIYEQSGLGMPTITAKDLELIHQPIDFIGLNIYDGTFYDHTGKSVPFPAGYPRTSFGWSITPEALYWGPYFFYERYHLPIIITENGMACHDRISMDGCVHDLDRIDFYHRYLLELKRAIDDGVEILGYFTWSLMDNFEWSEGYSKRFGIVYVDFQTGERTIKDSGYWYQHVIETNGDSLL